MSNKKTTKQDAAKAGLPSLSKSELKEWRELLQLFNTQPKKLTKKKQRQHFFRLLRKHERALETV